MWGVSGSTVAVAGTVAGAAGVMGDLTLTGEAGGETAGAGAGGATAGAGAGAGAS